MGDTFVFMAYRQQIIEMWRIVKDYWVASCGCKQNSPLGACYKQGFFLRWSVAGNGYGWVAHYLCEQVERFYFWQGSKEKLRKGKIVRKYTALLTDSIFYCNSYR